jgi:hypothetical protein
MYSPKLLSWIVATWNVGYPQWREYIHWLINDLKTTKDRERLGLHEHVVIDIQIGRQKEYSTYHQPCVY